VLKLYEKQYAFLAPRIKTYGANLNFLEEILSIALKLNYRKHGNCSVQLFMEDKPMKRTASLCPQRYSANTYLLPNGIRDISHHSHMVKQFLRDSYAYLGFSPELAQQVSESMLTKAKQTPVL
jgi:hypothetical protein